MRFHNAIKYFFHVIFGNAGRMDFGASVAIDSALFAGISTLILIFVVLIFRMLGVFIFLFAILVTAPLGAFAIELTYRKLLVHQGETGQF